LPEPEEFPLYNLAFKFSQKLEKLADDLRLVPEGADEYLILEGIKVISHYQSLIPPKVYRALTSKAEEEEGNRNLKKKLPSFSENFFEVGGDDRLGV